MSSSVLPAYSRRKILGLWAAVTLPATILPWGLTWLLAGRAGIPAVVWFLIGLTLSGVEQCILSLWLIRCEEGNLRRATLRRRLWLNEPLDPDTDEPGARYFWWLLLYVPIAAISLIVGVYTVLLVGSGYQWAGPSLVTELGSIEFAGKWWWMNLASIAWFINTYLGEELFFRGILLPRMGSFQRPGMMNILLYALYYIHKPWMIPFRLIEALVIVLPARKFRSNWMAIAVRAVEGVGVLGLVAIGVSFPAFGPMPDPIPSTYISRYPPVWSWPARFPTTVADLPLSDMGVPGTYDLKNTDLSMIDLQDSEDILLRADFDDGTYWPPAEQLPPGFDPAQIMELGKNPGLGLRQLHEQGITGRGVSIAIIDQPLPPEHQEYRDQLRWYEEINPSLQSGASMHGPAVASLAVGKTIGVAPEANLYYFSAAGDLWPLGQVYHLMACGIRRALTLNDQLPPDQKIRVISISMGWSPGAVGYEDVTAAVREAEEQGILVIYTSSQQGYMGLDRDPVSDPDQFESYEPGLFISGNFYATGGQILPGHIWGPMDSRTTASPAGVDEYVFYRIGGLSWTTPYLAGVYALAVQVDPSITPERFWELSLQTGRTITLTHEGESYSLGPIIDPPALIEALQK